MVRDPVTGEMVTYAEMSMRLQQRRRAAQAAAPRIPEGVSVVAKNTVNKGAPVQGNIFDGWTEKNQGGGIIDMDDPTNRDTVPAMLTPGEYVVNKEATQMYGDIIHQMNQHGLQQRHMENQLNIGGKVKKLYNEGYTAPGQAFAIAKSMGYNSGGLVSFLKKHEGWRDEAYDDGYGTWTIGYGRTTNADGSPIKPGQTTTREAEDAWIQDRAKSERAAIDSYAEQHGYDWSDKERDALASFRYNGGQGMIDQLTDNGTRDMATIKEKFPQYRMSNGQISKGLEKRRNYEMELAGWGDTQSDKPSESPVVPIMESVPEQVLSMVSQQLMGRSPPPAPMPQVGGQQPIPTAQEIRQVPRPAQPVPGMQGGMSLADMAMQSQGYNIGGWVQSLFGGNQGPAQDPMAGYSNYSQQDFLNEAETFNNPGAQTQGYEVPGLTVPSQYGIDMNDPGYMPTMDLRPLNSSTTAGHIGNQFNMSAPSLDLPPVQGSDEALLQFSSDNVENVEKHMAAGSMAPPPPASNPTNLEQLSSKQQWDRLKAQRDALPKGSPERAALSNEMNKLNVADAAMDPRAGLASGAATGSRGEEAVPELPAAIPNTRGGIRDRGNVHTGSLLRFDEMDNDQLVMLSNGTGEDALKAAGELAKRSEQNAETVKQELQTKIDNGEQLTEEEISNLRNAQQQSLFDAEGVVANERQLQYQQETRDLIAEADAEARSEKAADYMADLQSVGLEANDQTQEEAGVKPDESPTSDANITNTQSTVQTIVEENTDPDDPVTTEQTDAAATAGADASESDIEKAKDLLSDNFKGLFDKQELARAAVLFAGAMLTGASPQKALAIAGQQYLGRLDAKGAAIKKTTNELIKSGKYTPESIKKFEKSQNPEDLIQVETSGSFIEMGESKTVYANDGSGGKNVRKVKDEAGNIYWIGNDGKPINTSAFTREAYNQPGTKAYDDRIRTATNENAQIFKELQAAANPNANEFGNQTNLTPNLAGAEAAKYAAKQNIPLEQAPGVMQAAYAAALEDKKLNPDKKINSLLPYLNDAWIDVQTGDSGLFVNGKGQQDDAEKVNQVVRGYHQLLSEQFPNQSQGVISQKVMQHGKTEFNNLRSSNPETFDALQSEAKKRGISTFLWYLQTELAQAQQ